MPVLVNFPDHRWWFALFESATADRNMKAEVCPECNYLLYAHFSGLSSLDRRKNAGRFGLLGSVAGVTSVAAQRHGLKRSGADA